ncbi:MAG: hypothetical protein K2G70_06895 [Turicibacter sp.]|nr:hypothetical protein [Turicibacter sp.]
MKEILKVLMICFFLQLFEGGSFLRGLEVSAANPSFLNAEEVFLEETIDIHIAKLEEMPMNPTIDKIHLPLISQKIPFYFMSSVGLGLGILGMLIIRYLNREEN